MLFYKFNKIMHNNAFFMILYTECSFNSRMITYFISHTNLTFILKYQHFLLYTKFSLNNSSNIKFFLRLETTSLTLKLNLDISGIKLRLLHQFIFFSPRFCIQLVEILSREFDAFFDPQKFVSK